MGERPFAYVCSPFRGNVERNTALAKQYCRQVYEAGYTPIAPHLYFTQFLDDNYPKERLAGMEMGIALLSQCRVLLVCGSDITEGMAAEVAHAKRLGIEVCALENIPPVHALGYKENLAGPMTKELFWQIIDDARQTAGCWQDMLDPLVDTLSRFESADIIKFKQIYDEYLRLAYKDKLWAAAAVMHNGCSDDGFIDFRAWLIAQGKDVYMNALADPDSLANVEAVKTFGHEVIDSEFLTPMSGYREAADFESMTYAAYYAYKIKLGNNADIYDVINKSPLSDQEKMNIANEIVYAPDIDAKWGGHEHWLVTLERLEAMLPNTYKLFNKAEAPEPTKEPVHNPAGKKSVLDQIRQNRQTADPQPNKPNKKDKGAPEL